MLDYEELLAEHACAPRRRYYHLHADTATTFAELVKAYMNSWPELAADMYSGNWASATAYTDDLWRRARRVASQFAGIDLWDHLEGALRHTMKWYNPLKGPFAPLFERCLRERFRRAVGRDAYQIKRTHLAEKQYARNRAEQSSTDEKSAAFLWWGALLLDRSYEHLDPMTRAYVLMRRRGERIAAVAQALGVSEQALLNRYGGEKLAQRVRGAVREMVLALPARQRRLLARHLLEETELQPEQVVALLGVRVSVDDSVPVLEEGEILAILGWDEQPNTDFRFSSATEPQQREYGLKRRP